MKNGVKVQICAKSDSFGLVNNEASRLLKGRLLGFLMKTKELNLLPKEALLKTGEVDHADWNYRPLLGIISRVRFRLIKQMLQERRGARLLEIGYGSGIFLPELAKYSDEIYGVDVHNKQVEVAASLAKFGTVAELASGGAELIDHPHDFFDFVVAVSALEFVADLDAVCEEVIRILKPGGSFLVVTPGTSAILDLGLKILTGKNAKKDFGDRRELIMLTLQRHFEVKRQLTFPRVGSFLIKFYTALELRPQNDRG